MLKDTQSHATEKKENVKMYKSEFADRCTHACTEQYMQGLSHVALL